MKDIIMAKKKKRRIKPRNTLVKEQFFRTFRHKVEPNKKREAKDKGFHDERENEL